MEMNLFRGRPDQILDRMEQSRTRRPEAPGERPNKGDPGKILLSGVRKRKGGEVVPTIAAPEDELKKFGDGLAADLTAWKGQREDDPDRAARIAREKLDKLFKDPEAN